MTSKVFVAKLQGECSKCNKPIAVGQRIAKDEKSGKFQHADCLYPSKARNANSIQTDTSTESPGNHIRTDTKPGATASWPTPLDSSQIDRMLKEALDKAQEITGDPSHPFAVAIFKAKLTAAEQQFNINYSKRLAQEQATQQAAKLSMIKEVRGR